MTDWIEWRGGECPVDPDTRVDIWLRSGNQTAGFLARTWGWRWDPSPARNDGDIVAYRVVSEPPKPEEPKPDMINSPPHIDAYLAALNSYLDIDGAWRRELADATDAVNAKWADRKSAAHRELVAAYRLKETTR